MTPLVTIYIPTKNRPQLLSRAVKSCLAQDYLNLEIIIIDDCSDTVHTAIIDEVASLDPRIKLFRQPASLGACAARNRAIELAQGEFVTGLDDDDQFTANRISMFIRYWETRENTAFLCSGYQVFTKNLTFSYARTAREICWQQLLHSNLVGNQVFTRTKYLRHIGGFDVSMASCQDYDAWLRLSQRERRLCRTGREKRLPVHRPHTRVDPHHGRQGLGQAGDDPRGRALRARLRG